jgi:hypothetical protein
MDADLLALLRAVETAGAKVWNRNHTMQCPKCQHSRRRHKKARPLSVKRSSEGVLYHCWHCDWKGFLPSRDGVLDAWPRRRTPKKPIAPRLPVWF